MFIPRNAYRFISQQVSSDVEVHDTLDYKIKGTVTVTVEYNDTIKHIEEMKNMGEKLLKSQKETAELRKALSDVKNKITACEKKLQKVYKEISALNKENLCLESDLQNIQDQHQSVDITELQDEIE